MIYPLAFGCTAFLLGSFLTVTSEYLVSRVLLLFCIVALIFTSVILFIKKKNNFAFSCLFCIGVIILSLIYTSDYVEKREKYLNDIYNTEVTITAEVVKITKDYYIKVYELNNHKPPFNLKLKINSFSDIDCNEGDKLKLTANILPFEKAKYYGGFNARSYCYADNVYGYINKLNYEITTGKESVPVKLRKYINSSIDKYYSGDKASLLKALIIGDKTDMSGQLKDDLSKSGLAHIAVVSGMHISIIISVIGMCFGFLKRKRFIFMAIMFVFFGLIVAIIGGHPSVLRAVLMATYCIIAVTFKKRYDTFSALVLSGAILTIYNPFCVASISFILSFMATFALIIGSKKKGKNLLYVTISVFAITLPICMFYFNRATLAMFFTNLLISPLMIVMLPLGYISAAVPILSILQDWLLNLVLLIVKTFASIKLFNITTSVPTVFMILGIYSIVVAFFTLTLYKKKYITLVFCVIATVLIMLNFLYPITPDGSVTLFADNSNVMHIRTNAGKNIFITSDPDDLNYYIEDNNIKTIDALVLTKFTDNFEVDGVKKAYVPFVYEDKLKENFPVRYYEDVSFGIDDVTITPVSYLSYKTKVDERRAVLLVETKDITILFEPYKNDELNRKYLSDINADIVVLKYDSDNFKNIETTVGSSLQTDENMIYYNLNKCGSVMFYNNKIRTLR